MKKYKIRKIERMINVGLSVFAVTLFCVDSITIGSYIRKFVKRKEENIETLKSIDFSINYNSYEVLDRFSAALDKNKYLNDDEKELIRINLWVFVDNKDYMDLNYIEKVLSTLKIKYSKKYKRNKNMITKAEYFDNSNEIEFYHAESINDVDYSIFTHELYHSMQKKKSFDYNGYLIETINTIFSEEYSLETEKTLYSNYYYFTKMLIEIIGEEPFRKYQCYASTDYIVNALTDIYGSEDEAYDLLKGLDLYQGLYTKALNENFNSSKKMLALKKELVEKIDLYYKAKYGFSMENDLIMLYYYDNNKFYELISNRYANNVDGVVLYEYNNIDYFHGSEEHTLTIEEHYPIKIKNIIVGKDESEEIIEDRIITYHIDNSNRYINNIMEIKKKH